MFWPDLLNPTENQRHPTFEHNLAHASLKRVESELSENSPLNCVPLRCQNIPGVTNIASLPKVTLACLKHIHL